MIQTRRYRFLVLAVVVVAGLVTAAPALASSTCNYPGTSDNPYINSGDFLVCMDDTQAAVVVDPGVGDAGGAGYGWFDGFASAGNYPLLVVLTGQNGTGNSWEPAATTRVDAPHGSGSDSLTGTFNPTTGINVTETLTRLKNPDTGRQDALRWQIKTTNTSSSAQWLGTQFVVQTFMGPADQIHMPDGSVPSANRIYGQGALPSRLTIGDDLADEHGIDVPLADDVPQPDQLAIADGGDLWNARGPYVTSDFPSAFTPNNYGFSLVWTPRLLQPGASLVVTHVMRTTRVAVSTSTTDFAVSIDAPQSAVRPRTTSPVTFWVQNKTAHSLSGLQFSAQTSSVDSTELDFTSTGSFALPPRTLPDLPAHSSYAITDAVSASGSTSAETYNIEADVQSPTPASAQVIAPLSVSRLEGPYYVSFGDSITTGFSIANCQADRVDYRNGCGGQNPGVPYAEEVTHLDGGDYNDLLRVGIWGDTLENAVRHYDDYLNGATGNGDEGPWLPQIAAIDEAQGLVTGALGINDLHFSDVKNWIKTYEWSGDSGVTARADSMLDQLELAGDFDLLFSRLQAAKQRGARVLVFRYYNPYEPPGKPLDPAAGCSIAYNVARDLTTALNARLDRFSQEYGLDEIDAASAFLGHGAVLSNDANTKSYVWAKTCSLAAVVAAWVPSWIESGASLADVGGISIDPHPNVGGSITIANLVDDALRQG